ncbi:hypothetical protein Q7C36_000128 [Tachysurus vachellii]|uniref:Uncharacterized protein n=1 Tax=Tachysurus vachellii TaxID=175792 RepID=A0AA88P0P2_TACVA|nr:hypothetical protein Q7C36_000128 [Tachysurus vachellii]
MFTHGGDVDREIGHLSSAPTANPSAPCLGGNAALRPGRTKVLFVRWTAEGAESLAFLLQVGVQWRSESGRHQEKFPEVLIIGASLGTPPTALSPEAAIPKLLTFCSSGFGKADFQFDVKYNASLHPKANSVIAVFEIARSPTCGVGKLTQPT